MKSNIYYFDETGKQKESESFPYDLNKKNINSHKLRSKSYLNIFFYAWFIICIIFIVIYMIAYKHSNKMKNKKKVKKSFNENKNNIKDNDKIGIAFVFKIIYNDDVDKMLSLLANKLAKNNKYDIYLITGKEFSFDFKFNKKIKKIPYLGNKTSIEKYDKTSNIKYYFLNNELSQSIINWYKSLNGGKKVIGIMHGDYFSQIYTNSTTIYPFWKNNYLYDAFINLIPDEYYIYKKLGMNNTFYMPYLYPFKEAKIPNSKIRYNNLIIMGKGEDIIKEGIYGIKAMNLIVEKIPDAKLNIISTSYHTESLEKLIKELLLEENVKIYNYYEDNINITQYFLNSSVVLYPSINEYYPYIMNLAKSYAIPIIGFNLSYIPAYQKGVILVNLYDYKQMAKSAIKLLSDYEYRKIKGLEAKLSLNEYSNRETMDKWDTLFSILDKKDIDEYKVFQNNTYKEYYDEIIAKERLEINFNYAKKYNKHFYCHSFNDMLNLNYITNIKGCKNLFS